MLPTGTFLTSIDRIGRVTRADNWGQPRFGRIGRSLEYRKRSVEIALSEIRQKLLPLAGAALFALFIVTLPRYTDTAKIWFVLLILLALFYLVYDFRQLRRTSPAERLLIAAVIANFTWIALCFYANGEPGRGDAFLWGRHFYFLFVIPLFFLFRRIDIPDRVIVYAIVTSALLSFGDILVDLAMNVNHRLQGMNPNAFGPIQLCFSGLLLCFFIHNSDQKLRWLALGGAVIASVNVIFSMSRTTWITMIVMIVFTALYLVRSKSAGKQIALFALIALILSTSYLLPIVKSRVDYGVTSIIAYYSTDDPSDRARFSPSGVRFELWKTGWQMFLDNPLLGVGVGGFKVNAKLNWERYEVSEFVKNYKYVHNQYIAALATRGVPGLLLFLLIMLIPLYIALSSRHGTPGKRVARLSLMFVITTYLIGCLAEDHFEGKSAIMFVSVIASLLLAKISVRELPPGRDSLP